MTIIMPLVFGISLVFVALTAAGIVYYKKEAKKRTRVAGSGAAGKNIDKGFDIDTRENATIRMKSTMN